MSLEPTLCAALLCSPRPATAREKPAAPSLTSWTIFPAPVQRCQRATDAILRPYSVLLLRTHYHIAIVFQVLEPLTRVMSPIHGEGTSFMSQVDYPQKGKHCKDSIQLLSMRYHNIKKLISPGVKNFLIFVQ